MKDVADLAGVSRTTVSFVINKVPAANIPPETQERVWTAVEELGYRPNVLAQGLRSQQTHTIGFLSDEIATTPHAVHIIQGAQDEAWQYDKLILLVNTGSDESMKKAAVNMMLDRQVDGLIYATMYHREVHPPDIVHQLPTVLLDCFVADGSLPSIIPDEVNGGQQATEFLLQKGHRRIGFINNIDPIPARYGRLQGYQQALAAYGIPFDEDLTVYQETDPASGYDGTMALMNLSNPPTALFCFNDRMAMGAYDALRKLNLSIPDDVAVVGFDNQELIAAHLHPGLTTIALPHYEMGQWAVEYLLKLINKKDSIDKDLQYIINCPLIERDSA
ncbi:MAG: LacI family DNA-binding transcriptional regulator [Anaerolineales bacterium]|nr:LacI family DNA-binding transcriptional regulator [Anaerolineales bacterium]